MRTHPSPLAACAMAAFLATATALPAPAAGPHDGTYKGTYRTIRNDNSGNCDKLDNDNVSITVVDGKFTRTWAGNQLDITIAPDGTIAGSANRRQTTGAVRVISFEGKLANGVMEGEYGHSKCAVKFSLRKS